MKQKFFIFVLVASVLANFYFLFGQKIKLPEKKTQSLTIRVTRVIDGDTFVAGERHFRLAGVDAPEYPDGCLALKAKERLTALIDQKEIQIELTGEKSFEREIGFVFVKDAFVDKIMAEEGFGTAYGARLLDAADSAKKAKRGIWSELCQGNGCTIKGNYRKDNNTYIYRHHMPNVDFRVIV